LLSIQTAIEIRAKNTFQCIRFDPINARRFNAIHPHIQEKKTDLTCKWVAVDKIAQ
jgi:hypothetical protein